MNINKKYLFKLIEIAKESQKNSYSPYSNYPVGSSVLCESGKIYGGCNVENVSFGLSMCAERTAIFKAISNGEKKIKAICVVAKSAIPCGACRQVMVEFAEKDCDIICVDYDPTCKNKDKIMIIKLSKLLYKPFTPQSSGL
ncbi:MAG: cytidine deaminase [Elusimicrobiales bacterium]|nr:cytidine deaminase [Elusimicrobiales bacterium]